MNTLRLLDYSFATPAENLACDEALLEEFEDGTSVPTLRFWESPVYFVVVGYSNKIDSEVNRAECARRGVSILRRSSGGGTVVQGPGCLNYNLTLPIGAETAGIAETNCYIMRRQRDAIAQTVGREVEIKGHTDLTVGDVKFSGNAQRRKMRALVFHGCILLNFDLPLISELLAHPSKEPDYRRARRHSDFLTNLLQPADGIKEALARAWNASETGHAPAAEHIQRLVRERYANPEWNERF